MREKVVNNYDTRSRKNKFELFNRVRNFSFYTKTVRSINDLNISTKEFDHKYLTSYVNLRKYSAILFVITKIKEKNFIKPNQITMHLYNNI